MDIDENDQQVDPIQEARFGRPIKGGDYWVQVVKSEEGATNAGKLKTTVTVVTLDATPEQAPEGQVRVDYHCVVGQHSLKNMIETFEPEKAGKRVTLNTEGYVGLQCKAAIKWEPARCKPGGDGEYPAKAAIQRLIGPATRPAAKPANPDDLPF